jgi:hypothetical protein
MSNIVQFPNDPIAEEEPVIVSPTQWNMAFRHLDGQPISFDQQPWSIDILDCMDPWQVYRTGRQVSKSTTLVNKILAYSCSRPYFRTLSVNPTFKQARVFSNDRLRPAIMFSPDIKNLYFNSRTCQDQVLNRSYTTGSKTTMVHCYLDADSARGNSADYLCADEAQDLILDIIPVLEETLSRSKYDWRTYCGTPKTFDTTLEFYWNQSTQNEWVVRCDHCNHWNILGERNIGLLGLVCNKCERDIDWGNGQWVSRHPEAKWTGWHVSQLMCTEPRGWIKWDKILEKQKNYKRYLFFNEVLGEPYEIGSKPVTLGQLRACCKPDYSLKEKNEGGVLQCFAGLDWQMDSSSFSSYTVLTIYGMVGDRLKLVYANRYQGLEAADPDKLIEDVVKRCHDYQVQIIGCDWGVGHKENMRIAQRLGQDSVMEFSLMQVKEEIKYDTKRNCWNIDRTQRLDLMFNALRNGYFWFPKWEEFEVYHRDIYTMYRDFNDIRRSYRYLHSEPDDFAFATLFAMEAAMYYYDYSIPLASN